MDYKLVYDKTGWKHRMSERPSDPIPITHAVSALLDGFAHRYHVSIKGNTIASRYSARRIEAIATRETRTIVPFETERECAAECLRQLAAREGCETESFDTHLPPYDLDMSTVSPDRYIDRIGIELEGGWNESPKNHSLCYDGSVSVEEMSHVGEIRTRPFRFGEFLDANTQKNGDVWDEFFGDYPDEVNRTCGMHIHVSFLHKGYYAALVRREFHDWFLDGLYQFGKQLNIRNESFWKRLAGQNYYCSRSYWPTDQISARTKRDCRYTAINYCYALHRTIEFRVLPMFYQPEIAWRFVLEVGRLINVWLAYYGQAMAPFFAVATKKL